MSEGYQRTAKRDAESSDDVHHQRTLVSRAILCLLSGYLLLGIAHIAILPPWEGFDELAHYSYLQQLTDRWEVPRLHTARISKDVEEYTRVAPLPYSFENSGGITYEAFFWGLGETLARDRAAVHRRPREERRYAAGSTVNWELHQPPLYYLTLSPVYLATRHLSWAMHVFSLRLTSYVLAWASLVIGIYACITGSPLAFGGTKTALNWGALGIGLWPLLLPSWFPEMARIGNDSLCALILAGVWLVTIRAVNTGLSLGYSLTLGALLGLGCLTKAFFVPVTGACLAFWSVHAWGLSGRRGLVSIMPRLVVILLVVGVVGGWWYLRNWQEYGLLVGSEFGVNLERQGGLIKALIEDPSPLAAWLKGHVAMGSTLLWPGTWSLVGTPLIYLAPIGLTLLLVTGGYACALRRIRSTAVAWLPLWLLGTILVGLSYQSLVRTVAIGRGMSGYYLNFLAAALGAALGLGLGTGWVKNGFRTIIVCCVTYVVLFEVAMSWAQVMLFSGLSFRSGPGHLYSASTLFHGVFELPEALHRLTILAYPWTGTAAWALGGLFVLMGLVWLWKASCALHPPID